MAGKGLEELIYDAAKAAFVELFDRNEHFYYCSLTTTGEAHPPVVSAWSKEALQRISDDDPEPEEAYFDLKWSYADSPYYEFGKQHFAAVNAAFQERPKMSEAMSNTEWQTEYDFRLNAMERAMKRLSDEGFFGEGERREKVAVLVEVMPPDETNTARAKRLNPPSAIAEWLEEAAE